MLNPVLDSGPDLIELAEISSQGSHILDLLENMNADDNYRNALSTKTFLFSADFRLVFHYTFQLLTANLPQMFQKELYVVFSSDLEIPIRSLLAENHTSQMYKSSNDLTLTFANNLLDHYFSFEDIQVQCVIAFLFGYTLHYMYNEDQ